MIGAGWAYASVRIDLYYTKLSLRDTERELSATQRLLLDEANQLAKAKVQISQLETSLNQAKLYLAITGNNLAQSQAQVQTETGYVTNLTQCLLGVEQALNAISVNDNNQAVASLQKVSSACTQAQQDTGVATSAQGGPVYSFDFADPFVLRSGSTYYGYATNSAGGNVQMIRSTDLVSWSPLGDALAALPPWAQRGDTWAPGVMEIAGRYVMYYATAVAATGQVCISIAVSPGPAGPFVDSSTGPFICQSDQGGSIDPYPFAGSGGVPYLAWKSEGGGGTPSAIWTQQLAPDGMSLVGGPAHLISPGYSWEGTVDEGPAMVYSGGSYYLLFSANNWETARYVIGLAVCRSPLGPCTKDSQPLLASQGEFQGPGGPTVFSSPSGQLYMAFHAWLPDEVGYPNFRYLFIRQISVGGGQISVA